MHGLDRLIVGLNGSGSVVVVLAVALLLGLRHATDPDHLVAVSTLVASTRERAARRACTLGAAWGFGHATTLVACGVPIVLFGAYLPDPVRRAAEALVGVVIVMLALRLLRRWRRGAFHTHPHSHGAVVHRHLHDHGGRRSHEHEHVFLRSPLQAYGIGLVHGVGGSAGLVLLLLASIRERPVALAALLVFAFGAAASMAALSAALGVVLGRASATRTLPRLTAALALVSLVLGAWYTVAGVAP